MTSGQPRLADGWHGEGGVVRGEEESKMTGIWGSSRWLDSRSIYRHEEDIKRSAEEEK